MGEEIARSCTLVRCTTVTWLTSATRLLEGIWVETKKKCLFAFWCCLFVWCSSVCMMWNRKSFRGVYKCFNHFDLCTPTRIVFILLMHGHVYILSIKGIVHPQIKFLSSFTEPEVVPNLYTFSGYLEQYL